jgi:integrase
MRKHRKSIQYLQADERTSIKKVLRNEESKLSLREKAIGCLLYYNGLRCSDIANLRFSDIDWEREEISICQQKTDVPIKLPLTATVGNAIYDYVVNERGDSDCEYIFLSNNYPFQKLKASTIGNLTNQIYNAANIRSNPGDHRGGHLFRHNFATAMLENGASRVVISRALGHTSPVSSEVYISADLVHLKECALSIERFPIREGVFTSERV